LLSQGLLTEDIRGTGISEIVHAPNLKNKIGAGYALILSLRNSGANPIRRAKATARQERFNGEKTGKREKTMGLKAILPCVSFAIPIESGHLSQTAKALQVQGYKDEYL